MLATKVLQFLNGFLKLVGILLLLIGVVAFAVLKINWRLFYWDKDTILPSAAATPTKKPTITVVPTSIKIESDVKSIFNDKLTLNKSDNVDSANVNYIDKTVGLVTKVWSGNISDQLKLSIADFSTPELDSYQTFLDDVHKNKLIPVDLQKYYLDDNAKAEILKVALSSHSEYIKYLKARSVNPSYINELETNTILANSSRIEVFVTNKITDPESKVDYILDAKGDVVNNDYAKYRIILYTNDIFAVSDKIVKSGILGNAEGGISKNLDKYIQARDIAIRYVVYQQMTLGLQRAVDTVNAPTKYKMDKDSYTKAIKSLSTLGAEHYKSWGGVIYDQVNNRTLIQRLQANYVAYESLSAIYDMSDVQRAMLYDYLFESNSAAASKLGVALDKFSLQFEKVPIESMKAKILTDFASKLNNKNEYKVYLIELNNQYGQLPKLVADLEKMNSDEAAEFWLYIK
jgi:hypothetical protein